MTNPQSLLTVEEKERIISCNFKVFRAGFPINFNYIPKVLFLLTEMRKLLEDKMLVAYEDVKDADKKHAFISNKIHDVLRVNSILLKKNKPEVSLASNIEKTSVMPGMTDKQIERVEESLKQIANDAANSSPVQERKVGFNPILAEGYGGQYE